MADFFRLPGFVFAYLMTSNITFVIGSFMCTSGHVSQPLSLRMTRKSCIKAMKAPSATACPVMICEIFKATTQSTSEIRARVTVPT